MTNQEIEKLFDDVYEEYYLNPMELMSKLGEHVEGYNNSEFARSTGLSIFDAYVFYYKTNLTFKTILRYVQDVIDNIDYTKMNENLSVENLVKDLPEEYAIIFKDVLRTLNL